MNRSLFVVAITSFFSGLVLAIMINTGLFDFKVNNSKVTFRVATLSLSGSTFHEEAFEGFRDELAQKHGNQISLTSYIVDNQTMLTSMANDIVDKEYDLIYTVGAMCTQAAKAVTAKRQQLIPVVFAGVVSPAKIGVVQDDERPGGNLTGITLGNGAKQLIADLAVFLKPAMKKILIPWCINDNGGVIEADTKQLRAGFKAHGVIVKEVAVNGPSDVLEKVRPFISSVDTLLIPVGSVVSQVTEGLARLCARHGVTLIATVLDAANQGAAISWGLYCQKLGRACVPLVEEILLRGTNPAVMPIITMDECHTIAVNVAAAKEQGLLLTPAQLFCLKNGMVFGNSSVRNYK